MTSARALLDQARTHWGNLPSWAHRGAVYGGLAVLAGLIFLTGFQVAHREVGPYGLIAKIDEKLTAPFQSAERPRLENQTYTTTLLSLVSDVGQVPTGLGPRGGIKLYELGGGMTSFAGDVLLLAYTGDIFAATSAADIRKTNISAPDNGRAAYLALADTSTDYNFHLGYLRYNDLIFVDTPERRGLVASYSEFHGEAACTTNTLAFLPLAPSVTNLSGVTATDADWEILYRTSPCLPLKSKHLAVEGQMAGGRMAFAAPSTLYLTSGDYHLDGMRAEGDPIAQDQSADYGKLIAIDLVTGDASHVSSGHRNMQGIAFGEDGALYLAEHGPRGGDELNRIITGANYGWPRVSLGTAYSGAPLPNAGPLGRHEGYEAPVAAWVPSVAISGMARAEGFHPAWQGDLIVTTLQDRALHRVRMDGDRVQYIERIPIGQRLRQVHQHTDGRLVLWTDNQELVFLTAEDLSSEAEKLPEFIAALDAPQRVKAGFETAMGRCMECHSLAAGDHVKAPSLASIYGNDIGATSYAGYSDALRNASGHWDRSSLSAYLSDPQAYAPGTYMVASGSDDPRVIEAIIDYLAYLDTQF